MKTRTTCSPAARTRTRTTRRPRRSRSILADAGARTQWRAPHFVWQVREELGADPLRRADECEKIDTGGYKVITTLDYKMQRIAEKWVYAAAIDPQLQEPGRSCSRRASIPRKRVVAGSRACAATTSTTRPPASWTTGPARSSPTPGRRRYTAKGNKKIQPQFDVLADGWRQPGSSIKPLVYLDRHRRQDDDRVDDVHGRRHQLRASGAKPFTPTQADSARARARAPPHRAPVLAQHPGHQGRLHQRPRAPVRAHQGLRARSTRGPRIPVASMSIGTLEVHPIDMISAYGMIANGGVLMPRHTILKVLDDDGVAGLARRATPSPNGERVVEPPGGLHHHRHPRRQHHHERQPVLGQVARSRRRHGPKTRPAAYKTGTTSDNRDVHAYGYLAPPSNKTLPALVAGVWMGNSRQHAQRRQALARHLGAALVGDPVRGHQGHADRGLRPHQAQGPRHGDGRRVHGHAAERRHAQDGGGAVPPGHRPDDERDAPRGPSTSTRRAACCGRRAASARW